MSETVPKGWSRHKLGESLNPRAKSKLPSGESDPLGYYNFYVCSDRVLKSFHNDYSFPSILFSTGGEAAVHFATKNYSFSTDVWATQFEGEVCNEYVFCLLKENIKKINYSGFQGSGIKHLDKRFIEKLEFSIPPLPEQKKIASILTSVDEVIETTQKKIDKLQDLKKATMNELLTKGIGHTEFKDSELGRIPKSWEVRPLNEVAKIVDCKHRTPTYRDEGFPVVRPRDVKFSGIDFEQCVLVDETDFNDLNENHKPTVGDTIYSRNATFGIGSYVQYPHEFAIGQDVCIISPKNMHPSFLNLYLNSEIVFSQVLNEMSGSTFKRINLGSIKNFKIAVPEYAEQEKLENIISSVIKTIHQNETKLSQTQSLKKSLMQDLLTGKVRVQVN
ncbi:restriction endonuclease subunit S [Planktomarina temperata]|nr:restriction endonuclease subunit S [Planktomarina temperata]